MHEISLHCIDSNKPGTVIIHTNTGNFLYVYISETITSISNVTRCSAITERPRCRVHYSFVYVYISETITSISNVKI